MDRNEIILREIRRRTFMLANQLLREEEFRQDTQDTLDILQNATGLARLELEAIAADVHANYKHQEDNFFSIRRQIQLVGAGLGLILIMLWILIQGIF